VQDALLRALTLWPYAGIPENPPGWLFQVARNRALDLVRRDASRGEKLASLAAMPLPEAIETPIDLAALGDDELAMIFMCCHPELPEPARIALTLKTVGGFSVDEIAASLLADRVAVAQRLVRAKKRIREAELAIELPEPGELDARISSVLDVLYLMFNEGYSAHEGENVVRADLCDEAIRLTLLLAGNPRTARPVVHALLALMLLQAARLPARTDAAGDLLLLAEQDRTRWDRAMIADGLRALDRAATGPELTPFHVEAAIAACHAVAPDLEATDWAYVLRLYDDLLALKPSPIVALNRAIALARIEGPDAGIAAIEAIAADPALACYHLLPAALGSLFLESGRPGIAAAQYRAALALPCSAPERRFLERRLRACQAAAGSPPS
jgi:RNA polymerase sigma-70 factor (ECF subfamily)